MLSLPALAESWVTDSVPLPEGIKGMFLEASSGYFI